MKDFKHVDTRDHEAISTMLSNKLTHNLRDPKTHIDKYHVCVPLDKVVRALEVLMNSHVGVVEAKSISYALLQRGGFSVAVNTYEGDKPEVPVRVFTDVQIMDVLKFLVSESVVVNN